MVEAEVEAFREDNDKVVIEVLVNLEDLVSEWEAVAGKVLVELASRIYSTTLHTLHSIRRSKTRSMP